MPELKPGGLQIDGQTLIDKTLRKKTLAMVKSIYLHADLNDMLVSLTFVDDAQMHSLNKEWRQIDETTDVLSFAAQEGESMPGLERVLGDVVISVDRAGAQAKEWGHELHEEIAVLFAHGIFHLLGMDHERGHDEALLQAQCEMALLDRAGVKPELALSGRGLVEHETSR